MDTKEPTAIYATGLSDERLPEVFAGWPKSKNLATPGQLRASAEELVEHYPGEHAAMDADIARMGDKTREELRAGLLARADAIERGE